MYVRQYKLGGITLMKSEMKKVNIYIAGAFFSDEQVARIEKVEQALEANPFVESYFSPRQNQLDYLPFGSKEWADAIFKNDVHNVDWADLVVAVHDFTGFTELHGVQHHHVDSGTAWELGYAFAKNKPVILVHNLGGIVNLMLSQSLHAYLTDADLLADYNFFKMPQIPFTGEVL